MRLEGKLTLRAPLQKVWDVLFDPATLLSCIPGAEKVERLDDRTYDCLVKQKVGPISARFKFKATLTKIEPPNEIEFEGEGQDIGIARGGQLRQKSKVNLKETPDGAVEVSYVSDITIVGKFATFGERIMRAKAKEVEKELTERLENRLKSLAS